MATNEVEINEVSEQLRNSWKIPSVCQFGNFIQQVYLRI